MVSGIERPELVHVQGFEEGLLFPTQGSYGPHSDGPTCTARLAHSIAMPLLLCECFVGGLRTDMVATFQLL